MAGKRAWEFCVACFRAVRNVRFLGTKVCAKRDRFEWLLGSNWCHVFHEKLDTFMNFGKSLRVLRHVTFLVKKCSKMDRFYKLLGWNSCHASSWEMWHFCKFSNKFECDTRKNVTFLANQCLKMSKFDWLLESKSCHIFLEKSDTFVHKLSNKLLPQM